MSQACQNTNNKILIILMLWTFSVTSHAAIPDRMNFQAYMTDASGSALNGSYSIQFTLYNDPTGGTVEWQESQIVNVNKGLLNVLLGDVNPVALPFDVQYYLGVKVDDDPEMSPRYKLANAPYTFRAAEANAVTPDAITGAMIQDGAITLSKLENTCNEGDFLMQTGTGWQCSSACVPDTETCDGQDNDCDGLVDEDFPTFGQPCSVGSGACDASGFLACSADGATLECSATAGNPAVEICDGIDNDCDGISDNNLAAVLCVEQLGVCAGASQTCTGISGYVCDTSIIPDYEATESSCDGNDNDCDGVVDNNLLPPLCPQQQGICAGSTQICTGGTGWAACDYSSVSGYEAVEISCDNLDNDCDGTVDEGWLNGGKYNLDTACGNCATDCTAIFNQPHTQGACDSVPPQPVCIMACDAGFFDLNAVPNDGCEFQLDSSAIYVSSTDPSASDAADCGSGPVATGGANFPCLSINVGIARAQANGKVSVLVADGLYHESVTIVDGISLYGGHRADTWERNAAASYTRITGNTAAGQHKKTIIAQNIMLATTIDGFIINGENNFNPMGNSYVLWLVDNTGFLIISNNNIIAGNGGQGSDGGSGSDGTNGGPGAAGQNTITTSTFSLSVCQSLSSTPGSGGNNGANTCGGQSVRGGSGAGAQCPDLNSQQSSGENGKSAPGGGAAGPGGSGGYDRFSSNCNSFSTAGFLAAGNDGSDGQAGTNGNAGSGCFNNLGLVNSHNWSGFSGNNGVDGMHGGGGGGGGAGGGADLTLNCSSVNDSLGGSGGGGGAGGCGGTGGGRGSAGGGSFGVFLSYTSPSFNFPIMTGNTITPGAGGTGGDGGFAGSSGQGGNAANGGAVSGPWAYAMGNGGPGGKGGSGGHGGGASGGCGGVSYGIYINNFSTPPGYATTNLFISGGAGGTGGTGGSSLGNSGIDGLAGSAVNTNF